MSSSIPSLKLFPLYPGGPTLQTRGTLSADSQFRIPATSFSAAYEVNRTPNQVSDTFYQIHPGRFLSQASQGTTSNALYSIQPSQSGYLSRTTAPSSAPSTPDLFRDITRYYAISDLKFSELMTQDSFKLPRIGMGLRVETDGAGNATRMTVDPSIQHIMSSAGATDPRFAFANRAEILNRAFQNTTPQVNLQPQLPPGNQPIPGSLTNAAVQPLPQPLPSPLLSLNPLNRSADIFTLNSRELTPAFGHLSTQEVNPVLERLRQLQPVDPGLSIAGFNAEATVTEARQIAANQAKLDVFLTDRAKENVDLLQKVAIQQSGAAYSHVKAMDGFIPMAPSLPAPSKSAFETGTAGFGALTPNTDNFGGVLDSTSKRGSGGYIPFQLGSGGQEGFSGQSNPFGGNTAQQQRQPRPRLAFHA